MSEVFQYIGSAVVILLFWVWLTIQIGRGCINEHYTFTRYQTYGGNYAYSAFYCGCIGQLYGIAIVGSIYLITISIKFLVTN